MKRLFPKALYLFVVTAMLCGCEFISSIENGGGEQETPDKEFKILVSDFGDFDEFAYNENTFVIYNHNDKGLPEWMFTYTYDEPTDAEHYEYVVFDERGIPEYYNIDNESIYIDNVRGNLVDMIVIAEDGSFSVVPDMDTGVNLETFWSEKGELTRAGDGEAGTVSAQRISNYAKGGVSFMQGSFEFWGGAFMMLTGCAMLVPGVNVIAGATLMIAGATGFVTGAMHLTMATDLMHSDGTHTEYMEPVADAMGMVSGTVGSYGKPIAQSCAEWCIEKTVDQGLSYFDKRASEVVTYEKAVEAVMLSLRTASYDVDIATESVTLYGSIDGEIGAGDYVGLYVSDEPTAMHVLVASKATIGSNGSFQIICDGLEMGHTYYYKSYYYSATQDRTYIANTREFVLPGVVTGDYEKVGDGQYRVKLEALLDEEILNPTVGICWSTNNSTPTTDDSCSTATIIESGAYGAVIEPSKLPCYYRAFIEVDGEAIYGDVRMIAADERDILIKFYHDTGGDNWTCNDNWCSDKPIEEWYGVHYCSSVDVRDGEDNVLFIEFEEPLLCISLKHNNLVGSGSLAGLSSLAKLNLGGNDKLHSLDVSNCNELRAVVYKGGNLVSLNASGCTKLVYVQCKDNQLTYLNCSGCAALEHLRCENNQLTQEITGIFAQIPYFDYDVRYEYWDAWVDGVRCYTDRGVGWWFPGEPQKGYHGK